jgi:hypothetical protein
VRGGYHPFVDSNACDDGVREHRTIRYRMDIEIASRTWLAVCVLACQSVLQKRENKKTDPKLTIEFKTKNKKQKIKNKKQKTRIFIMTHICIWR